MLVDARGHRCPVPTLKLRKALETADEVTLLADDPMARIDVPHFAREVGAEVVSMVEEAGVLRFELRTPLPPGEGGARSAAAEREGEGRNLEVEPRIARARRLRRNSQDAEWKLWHALRNRQLRGCKFRRQHPIDRFYADFACVDRRLVVELDGPQHAEQARYDERRTQDMTALGWTVLRFWNDALDDSWSFDGVLTEIGDALDRAKL